MAHQHATAAFVLMLAAGASTAAAPVPVDGMWTAPSDGLGGELTLFIKTQGHAVTGHARSSRGALEGDPFTLTGSYQAPALKLRLKSPDGLIWSLSAQLTGSETMRATLTWPTGTVQALTFVRP